MQLRCCGAAEPPQLKRVCSHTHIPQRRTLHSDRDAAACQHPPVFLLSCTGANYEVWTCCVAGSLYRSQAPLPRCRVGPGCQPEARASVRPGSAAVPSAKNGPPWSAARRLGRPAAPAAPGAAQPADVPKNEIVQDREFWILKQQRANSTKDLSKDVLPQDC